MTIASTVALNPSGPGVPPPPAGRKSKAPSARAMKPSRLVPTKTDTLIAACSSVRASAGRPLRKNQNAGDDQRDQCARRRISTQCQPSLSQRLVEEIANYRTQRPRQNERRPEKGGARGPSPEVGGCHHGQQHAEHQGVTGI